MASKITYDDKVSLTTSALPKANKCTDDDLNEIKQVVNNNADELDENTTNIEEMQQQIVKLKGTILYEDSTGTAGAVNLSESLQTGDEIEIIYCRRRAGDGTSVLKSTGKIPYTANMEIALDINYYSSDTTQQVISKIVFVNGNSITVRGETTSSNSASPITTSSIYILEVIKY